MRALAKLASYATTPKQIYDKTDETKEGSDVVAVLFFVREMDKSFLDSSNIFLMTNIFCNIFCKIYFFEMDEARRLRK